MSFDPDLYRRTVRLAGRGDAGADLVMSVIDAGPRDASRTLVFLHGMGGYAAYWKHQLSHYYESCRVIAPDLRGHGLSDAPRSRYDREELLGDLEGVLAALDMPRSFSLVTHSFGGALGTVYTAHNPDRVDKLVIIGSAVRFDKLKNMGRFLLRAPSWLLRAALVLMPGLARRYPPSHVVHAQYRNAVITYDGTAYLQAIRCPSLVILGDRDKLFDSSAYQAIAKLIPGAQEVRLPLSAHQVMVERPDAVNRALDRFLGPVHVQAEVQARKARNRALEAARPWLKFYDGRTPYQIRPPQGPLQRHLEIAAKRFAASPALAFEGRTLTYKQLDRRANRFAEGLRRQGVVSGARVLIALPNMPQGVIAYFAVLKLGAVAVFIAPQASRDELVERVQSVSAHTVVALSNRYAELQPALLAAGVKVLVLASMRDYMGVMEWLRFSLKHHYAEGHSLPLMRKLVAGRQVFRFKELLSLKTERPEPEPDMDSPALIQFTSGSGSSAPKPVHLSHRNLVANALQVRHWLPEVRVGDERILALGNFSSNVAATLNLAPMLGGCVILVPRFDELEVLRIIRRQRPTFMPASPRIYQRLSQVPQVRKYGVASIRVCFSAGTHLPLEVQESFEKLTRGRVVEAYTTVECGVALANPLAARKRPGAIGVPLPDVEAKLVHAQSGAECGEDEVGELWLRGPQIAEQSLTNGWFVSGDLARRDADGFFYLVERQDSVIAAAGDAPDIYPSAIEDVLYELQEVSEVAVAAWREDAGQQAIVAFIVPSPLGASLDESRLRRWCEERLPPASRPTQFKAITELPRSATGKLLRRKLRDMR